MALPVVGKFFNKLYRDPAFRDYKNHYFPGLDETTLALLDIPHFTETNNEKGISNLWGLFGGGNAKKREQRQAEREGSKNPSEMPADAVKTQPAKEEPKSNIW